MGYYNSFVVRIWCDGHGRLRGRVEHVATHESLIFLDLTGVLDFLRSHLDPPPDLPAPVDDDDDDIVSNLTYDASAHTSCEEVDL